jgi:hypothetical protein
LQLSIKNIISKKISSGVAPVQGCKAWRDDGEYFGLFCILVLWSVTA